MTTKLNWKLHNWFRAGIQQRGTQLARPHKCVTRRVAERVVVVGKRRANFAPHNCSPIFHAWKKNIDPADRSVFTILVICQMMNTMCLCTLCIYVGFFRTLRCDGSNDKHFFSVLKIILSEHSDFNDSNNMIISVFEISRFVGSRSVQTELRMKWNIGRSPSLEFFFRYDTLSVSKKYGGN